MNSIKFKVAGTLGLCLVLIFGSMIAFHHIEQTKTLSRIYGENSESLQYVLDGHLQTIMAAGENETIQPLVEDLVKRNIASEITIVNGSKIVTRSSELGLLNTPVTKDDEIWNRLFLSGADTLVATQINEEPAEASYHVFRNKPACMDCHEESEGQVLGGLKVVKSKAKVAALIKKQLYLWSFLGLVAIVVLSGMIYFVLKKKVFLPLFDVGNQLERVVQGEIGQVIEVRSDDEIGTVLRSIKNLVEYLKEFVEATQRIANRDLTVSITPRSEKDIVGHSFAKMIGTFCMIIGELKKNANELASISETINHSANAMATRSEEILSNVQSSAQSANEINGNMDTIAASVEQMSSNVNFLSSSAESMAKSVNDVSITINKISNDLIEVSNSSEQTAQIAKAADSTAQEAKVKMDSLAHNAKEIGKIVNTITDIADQTNLLALNATIEAASAGDAGKGFAVVANEVKELAKQTALATASIVQQIETIQNDTNRAVDAIAETLTVTKDIDGISANVAHVIDAQSLAAKNVLESASTSARETESVSTNAKELAQATSDIAQFVNQASTGTGIIAQNVNMAANGINDIAQDISNLTVVANDIDDRAKKLKSAIEGFIIKSDPEGKCSKGIA